MEKIIVFNQKMFLTYDEAKVLMNELKDENNENFIVAPNFLNMKLFKDFNLCAQNCHYENAGARTGEVSPYHLSLVGVKYVLLGHSERREVEDDYLINKKVVSATKNSLIPILCIGETYLDNQMHRTSEVLKKQLKIALTSVDKDSIFYVAYEPRWLIGGKNTLTKNEIEDSVKYIKKILTELGFKNNKILYGGSVNKSNIDLILSNNVDGYLLGNASCNIDELKYIINCIKSVK